MIKKCELKLTFFNKIGNSTSKQEENQKHTFIRQVAARQSTAPPHAHAAETMRRAGRATGGIRPAGGTTRVYLLSPVPNGAVSRAHQSAPFCASAPRRAAVAPLGGSSLGRGGHTTSILQARRRLQEG